MASEGAPPPPAVEVFRSRRTVVERDLDALEHVNNVVWLRFVMELAHAHSEAAGLGLARLRELGGVWVVHRHELDYHRPAELGDEILEETWVSKMSGARSVRHARLRSVREGSLHLEAVTNWAFVDPASGRPRRLPREVIDRFIPLAEPPAAETSG